MTAALVVAGLNFSLGAEELPQRLEDYQIEAFAQNGPLDRLKKRSPKRRWNEVRRDDRTSRRDADEKTPEKLSGNPERPVPFPEKDNTIPETLSTQDDTTNGNVESSTDADVNSLDAANEAQATPEITIRPRSTTAEPLAQPATSTTRDALDIPATSSSEAAGDTLDSPPGEEIRVPAPRIAAATRRQVTSDGYEEPVRSPAQLKSINDILPFRNYEPDSDLAANDPCNNLCPRPDGTPCEPLPDQRVPECPEEFALSDLDFGGRSFDASCYLWEPSNIFYHPPYFQDTKLERYGQTYHDVIQPFASVGRFGIQLVGLPYQMVIDQPCRKVYPLGYYRPGDCAPKRIHQIPWNTRAALFQAEVVTGAILLFP